MSAEKTKKKQAAALRYEPDRDDVPVVAAVGEGYLAERIIEKAEEHGIPVVEDAGLASVLTKMSAGDYIPPQLYEVVAKVLVFISQTDRGYGEKIKTAGRSKTR
ncbi:MAG: EscU/YscU/HrcU family type III secretion system export apparatus switch protein [Oscillospiraceae bacterium]|nr:EscU/YscU/HrcU family type III secretion system export apparatus switch protein [Oscillospiraceae bacterium]